MCKWRIANILGYIPNALLLLFTWPKLGDNNTLNNESFSLVKTRLKLWFTVLENSIKSNFVYVLFTAIYTTCTSPIMHRPPKFCVTFVFHFFWVLQPSQEKLKTMLMQFFFLLGWGEGGGGDKVHYGWCAGGVGTFSTYKLTRPSNRTPIVPFCFCSDHFVCICCGLILSLV